MIQLLSNRPLLGIIAGISAKLYPHAITFNGVVSTLQSMGVIAASVTAILTAVIKFRDLYRNRKNTDK